MSFGKDPNQLDQIPSFGGSYIQRSKTAARRLPSGGGGGGHGFHWKGNYRPPEHAQDTVRLIPGDYPQEVTHNKIDVVIERYPFYICREHSTQQGRINKTSICSAGPLFSTILNTVFRGEASLAQPCNCCPLWAEDVKARDDKKRVGDTTKGPRRMSVRDMFAFSCWDYGLYFEVPETDKQGQVRMNTRSNQPYTEWVKGNPNDPNMQGRPWKSGNLAPWYMGKTHKEALINHEVNAIGKMCKTCGTRDSIVTVLKMCGNPNCGQFIYDPNSTTLSNEQRAQIDFYPYTCSFCGVESYVDEVIECNNPNCTHTERSTIFDVDLVVQRMKSGDGQQTFLQILNFSEPRPIQVTDPATLESIKPLDLAKKFGPTPLDAQLQVHGMQQVQQPAQAVAPQQMPPQQVPQQMPPQQPQMGVPPFAAPAVQATPAQQPGAMAGMQHQPAPAPPGYAAQPPGVPPMPAAPVAIPMQMPPQQAAPQPQPPVQLAAPAVQAPPVQAQPQPVAAMPAVAYQVPAVPQPGFEQ